MWSPWRATRQLACPQVCAPAPAAWAAVKLWAPCGRRLTPRTAADAARLTPLQGGALLAAWSAGAGALTLAFAAGNATRALATANLTRAAFFLDAFGGNGTRGVVEPAADPFAAALAPGALAARPAGASVLEQVPRRSRCMHLACFLHAPCCACARARACAHKPPYPCLQHASVHPSMQVSSGQPARQYSRPARRQ